jgi:hypothetical protein
VLLDEEELDEADAELDEEEALMITASCWLIFGAE